LGVYKEDNLSLRGLFDNGKFVRGKFFDGSGVSQQGEFDEQMRVQGEGKIVSAAGELLVEGHFVNGKIVHGTQYFEKEGCWYEGEFENNNFNGKGKLYTDHKLVYDGHFKDSRYHG